MYEQVGFTKPTGFIPGRNIHENILVAQGTTTGQFAIANVYSICAGIVMNDNPVPWKDIWSPNVPERIRSLVWMMHHDGLKTNKYLHWLQLRDPYCEECGGEEETILHVMRDCPQTKQVWLQLLTTHIRQYASHLR